MFGPKWSVKITPKLANFISGDPIALERIPPTDGFLVGIVCLPPALASTLTDAVVMYVIGNRRQGLNLQRDWILYNISQGPAIFWLSSHKGSDNTVDSDRAHKKSTPSGARKLMTVPILCRQWHRWRVRLEDGREKEWEECTKESPS